MTLGRSDTDHVTFEVSGTLLFTSAMHSRGSTAEVGLDAPLVRDGLQRFIIPGSSLAGALRAWTVGRCRVDHSEEKFGPWTSDHVDELFGPPSIRRSAADGKTASSLVVCADTVLKGEETLRHGVGINRFTGTAAENFKFDHIVLAPGASGPLRITCRLPAAAASDDSPILMAFLACLAALRDGQIPLGGLVTKGFGRCILRDARVVKWKAGRKAVLARVKYAGATAPHSSRVEKPVDAIEIILPTSTTVSYPSSELSLRLKVTPLGPVFNRFEIADGIVDAAPLVERHGEDAHIVITGSSIKGVLRSEAERIMRTILGIDCGAEESLNSQVRVGLVSEVFGSGKLTSGEKGGGAPNGYFREQRGALICNDLTAKICSWENWKKVLAAVCDSPRDSDKKELARKLHELRVGLNAAGLGAWRVATNVAIDRWTGAAADKKLFSTLEPHRVDWGSLDLRLDYRRLAVNHRSAGLVLILLALTAVNEQRLGFGFGFDRGYGRLRIDELNGEGFEIARNEHFNACCDDWTTAIGRMKREEPT